MECIVGANLRRELFLVSLEHLRAIIMKKHLAFGHHLVWKNTQKCKVQKSLKNLYKSLQCQGPFVHFSWKMIFSYKNCVLKHEQTNHTVKPHINWLKASRTRLIYQKCRFKVTKQKLIYEKMSKYKCKSNKLKQGGLIYNICVLHQAIANCLTLHKSTQVSFLISNGSIKIKNIIKISTDMQKLFLKKINAHDRT